MPATLHTYFEPETRSRAMRLLLALILLAPLALAQPDVIDWIDAEIAPFADLVVPLQGPQQTTMVTRVSCALGDPVVGTPITYTVVDPPAWLSATISPASDVAPVGLCADGYSEARSAEIIVTASDQAPAFAPILLVVEIAVGTGERAQKERVSVNVSASYYSVLDVQVPEALATIPPGGSHDFQIPVVNFGNAPTRVEAVVAQRGDGIVVSLPPPLVLGSRQQGASDIAGTIVIGVSAPEDGGFVNRAETVNINVSSSYANDDSYGGDSSTISFLVTVRSGAAAAAENAPVASPGLPLLLAALALAAVLSRRGG